MLKDGWRPAANSAYNLETLARLIEATLALSEESKRMVRDAQRAIDKVKFSESLSMDDHHEVGRVSQRLRELESEFTRLELALKIKTKVKGF
jgi:hypothetical protein